MPAIDYGKALEVLDSNFAVAEDLFLKGQAPLALAARQLAR